MRLMNYGFPWVNLLNFVRNYIAKMKLQKDERNYIERTAESWKGVVSLEGMPHSGVLFTLYNFSVYLLTLLSIPFEHFDWSAASLVLGEKFEKENS